MAKSRQCVKITTQVSWCTLVADRFDCLLLEGSEAGDELRIFFRVQLISPGWRPKAMIVHRALRFVRIFNRAVALFGPRTGAQTLPSLLLLALLFAAWEQDLAAYQDAPAPAQSAHGIEYLQQTPEQLQQLVAPIALYPDSLVAQILGASTFPEQVVEADRWVQSHPDLKVDDLAQAVDQQPWDPSVKALTAFPSVLGNMDKNLSWTSSLGDAYYNQQEDVMDAVQVMRQRAQEAGNLKTTPQQTVTSQGSTIIIEPASQEIVYVPAYDPWVVYGDPIVAWPEWYPYPGIWYGGPYLSFGVGFGIGYYGGYEWGWHHWGSDWHHRSVIYNHDRYYSGSRTFYKRNTYYRGEPGRGGTYGEQDRSAEHSGEANRNVPEDSHPNSGANNRSSAATASPRPFNGNTQAARGYAEPHGQSGVQSGAFSNYDHGGETRGYSSRGSASFGGGGYGGGGGSHGGGHH